MTQPKRLIMFDVDGTLVDSQNDIVRSMTLSFEALGLDAPDRSRIVGIIGLSLEIAVAQLTPDLSFKMYDALVEGYKSAYTSLRARMAARCLRRSIPMLVGCCKACTIPRSICWVWQLENHGVGWMFCCTNMTWPISSSRYRRPIRTRPNRILQCCRRRWMKPVSRRKTR